MVSKEIQEEIEYARKEVLDAPNNMALSNEGIMMQIERASSRLLDLIRLCIGEKEIDYAMDLCEETKSYVKQIVEFKFGASFREASDYVVQHTDVKDSAYDLYWKITLEQTPYRFEPFMFYMEKNRPFAKKFYEPRRYTKSGKPALKIVADALQALEFKEYDFLGVSQPARTGKSSICIFYLCWKSLRHPNDHSAMVGHSGILVKGFYKEVLNLMTSAEYTFEEMYKHYNPMLEFMRDKSAEDYTITLGDPDRFATITCRGIDGTLTGAVDVSKNGVLYIDDLVRDREHSLSPARMESTFQDYLNKCVDRKQDGAQELMIGTLWNVLDPLERLSKIYADNPRYRFLRLPALDDNDESNFDYVLNGFPTEYYKDMRSRLDNAEWQAKYQQKPYVREGLLFPQEEMTFFDGIVRIADIKRVYSVTDTAVGGGDNVSAPICYELNNGRKLICKWIYDKRSTKFTVPRVINAYKENCVTEARIEKNGVGAMWYDNAQRYITENNIVGIKIIPVLAPARMSKEDKIQGYSDAIKGNYEFLTPNPNKPDDIPNGYLWFERDADYQNAMDCMSMYTCNGKNVFDDSPDSMAQLAIMDEKKKNGQINVIHMPDGFGI